VAKRPTFSVSRAFYQRASKYCAERGIALSRLVEQVLADAMAVPYVARPAPVDPVAAQPVTPRAAVYTCTICGAIGHNARFHERPAEIEVSPGMFELLSDLRVRARELRGEDISLGELLEQGIGRALAVEERR